MARELSKMDAARSQTKVGRHATGEPGLYVQVAQGRDKVTRSWILRYMIAGQARQLGLGSLDVMPTTEARRRAMKARLSIRDGIDPLAEKEAAKEAALLKRARTKTFAECAEDKIAIVVEGLTNEKHQAQWKSTLKTYAYPLIGDKAVDTITVDDVEAILKPIWATKRETASRVRGRIEAVLDYAKAKKFREGDNPAAWKGNLKELLGSSAATKKHQPSLPYAEVAKFVIALRQREGMAAMALEFGILCAARSGEVLGATWDEIDMEAKLWTIPADRMKAKREHTIPLTDAALALLAKASALKQADVPYVFPAARGGKLSDMALSMLIRRMNGESPQFVDGRTRDPIVPHGFRSTFRDWAGETTAHPREVIEHALAHQLKDKAEASYARGKLLVKRRKLMDDWAVYCARHLAGGNNVVSIKADLEVKIA